MGGEYNTGKGKDALRGDLRSKVRSNFKLLRLSSNSGKVMLDGR